MALTILAKITSSSHSFYFPLWELKSEAQTLNPNSFLPTFSPGPSPCHTNAPFLIPLGQRPAPSRHSAHPEAFSFLWGLSSLFRFFTPWHEQLFSTSFSPPPPAPQSGVGCWASVPTPVLSTRKVPVSRDPAWGMALSPPTGTCKSPGKLLLPFQALVPTGLASCSQCQKVLRKSGLRKAFLPWDSLREGFLRMSFLVLCITSREIPCRPYWWWWWWWFLSLFLLSLSLSFIFVFFFSGSRPPTEQIANTLTWSRKESCSGTSPPSQTRPWPVSESGAAHGQSFHSHRLPRPSSSWSQCMYLPFDSQPTLPSPRPRLCIRLISVMYVFLSFFPIKKAVGWKLLWYIAGNIEAIP